MKKSSEKEGKTHTSEKPLKIASSKEASRLPCAHLLYLSKTYCRCMPLIRNYCMSQWPRMETEPRAEGLLPFPPRKEVSLFLVHCFIGRWGIRLSPSWQYTCLSMCPTSMWQPPGAGPPWSTTQRWSSLSSMTRFSGEQVCPRTSSLFHLTFNRD